MTQTASDLETLAPEPTVVVIHGGEKIEVHEFKFGHWPRAIKLFRPVTDAVQRAGIAGFNGAGLTLAPDWAMRLPQIMDEGGEALIDFVGFAIGKPRGWFDTLGGDDGIALTKAVFETNGSFFLRKISPLLGLSIGQDQAPAAAADGVPSSPDSSPAATAATASTA